MGLSSSQARLLSLTGRMHDIEYKAQRLEAQKLQMANESRHVYQEYEDALNASKIQLKQISPNGSISFIDATYNNMKLAGYDLSFDSITKVRVTPSQRDNFEAARPNKDYFIALETGRSGEIDDAIEIYTADQLKNMVGGNTYRLMSDITLDSSWTSKNIYNVTFDGNGHTIKGLDKALFGDVTGGEIKNLNVEGNTNGTSTGLLANSVGGSAGSEAKVNNVTASGSVNNTGASITGGLIGYTKYAKIESCSANVNVTGANSAGVAGLIGNAQYTTINNCSATGNITGKIRVAGLVSYLDNSSINHSYANCNIIVNNNETSTGDGNININSAGLVAASSNANIKNSLVEGTITNENTQTGSQHVLAGIVSCANQTTIEDCDVSVKINANDATGTSGVVGWINDTTRVKNCNVYTEMDSNNTCYSVLGSYHLDTIPFQIDNTYVDVKAPSSPVDVTYGTITPTGTGIATSPVVHSETVGVVTPPTVSTTYKLKDHMDSTEYEKESQLFDQMSSGYVLFDASEAEIFAAHADDSEWLTNMINLGEVFIFKTDSTTGKVYQTNIATDTNLQEVSNEANLKKAEAKYEADMRRIDAKDKKFDTDLAALDNERNAIKTEMDTLKSVAKENVDRSFKLFS